MRAAVAVIASLLLFAIIAVGTALLYSPTRDLKAMIAYIATLQAAGVGIAVANIWLANRQSH